VAAPSATLGPTLAVSLDIPKTAPRNLWLQAIGRTVGNRMGLIGTVILLIVVGGALLAPWISPYDPIAQHPGKELLGPTGAFLLGTDDLGRDLLSRVIFGTRPSLVVGVLAVTIGATIGCLSGLLAGYSGGWLEALLMRVFDAVHSFPPILLGTGIVAVLGPGTVNVAYAVAIAGIPSFARLTRSAVLAERRKEYVLAAESVGVRSGRIMLRHVLPNCIAPILVQITQYMGIAILAEAGLSFLGIGTAPPNPSWGAMLNESRAFLRTAPWMAVWPGVGLALLVLGLNYVQDALRDALDPRRINANM
jgi:peptide/nickel transport system permease protein